MNGALAPGRCQGPDREPAGGGGQAAARGRLPPLGGGAPALERVADPLDGLDAVSRQHRARGTT